MPREKTPGDKTEKIVERCTDYIEDEVKPLDTAGYRDVLEQLRDLLQVKLNALDEDAAGITDEDRAGV